jgi:hypothetical protein
MRTDSGFGRVASLAIAALLTISAGKAFAQPSGAPCKPATQQFGDQLGCWIISHADLGQLPQEPLFWHLDLFPTLADAEAAKGPGGTVIEVFEKIWLSTIAGASWRATGGSQVAIIGPLPGLSPDEGYTAQYMETVTVPGHSTSVHRHSGPEAVYTLTGQICLENDSRTCRRRVDFSRTARDGDERNHGRFGETADARAHSLQIIRPPVHPGTRLDAKGAVQALAN